MYIYLGRATISYFLILTLQPGNSFKVPFSYSVVYPHSYISLPHYYVGMQFGQTYRQTDRQTDTYISYYTHQPYTPYTHAYIRTGTGTLSSLDSAGRSTAILFILTT